MILHGFFVDPEHHIIWYKHGFTPMHCHVIVLILTDLSKCCSLVLLLHTVFSLSCRHKIPEWSSDDETKELNAVAPALTPIERVQTEVPAPAPCHSYKKSLRLSSDQIVRQLMVLFYITHK